MTLISNIRSVPSFSNHLSNHEKGKITIEAIAMIFVHLAHHNDDDDGDHDGNWNKWQKKA